MAKHELIIGLDFGHGEVAAHFIRGSRIESLILNQNQKDKCIMAALAYGPGVEVFIGPAAADRDTVEAYFKASPAEWEEKTEGGHVKRLLMHDFIRKLFAQIREANPMEMSIDPKKILLLVGCPTSDAWLQTEANQAYVKLLQSATGIGDVMVLPESRAAIFSAFHMVKNLQLDTTRGVAVFDFGSSTADFTYYQLGKKRTEFNCRLGASEIEGAIVNRLLGMIQGVQVVRGSATSAELQVRKLKEEFFNAVQAGQPYDKQFALELTKAGFDGKPILVGTDRRTKMPIYDKVSVTDRMNGRLIDWATMEYLFPLPGERERSMRSWYDHCRHFYEEAKRYLDVNNLPCQTIVLTGGASKMDFVRELCQATFPRQYQDGRIYVEENPSYSVSIGLCHLSQGQELMEELLTTENAKLRRSLRGNIDTMVEAIAKEMAQLYYDRICKAMGSLHGAIHVGTLTDAIEGELKQIPAQDMQQIVSKHSTVWKGSAAQTLHRYSLDIVKRMFPGLGGSLGPDVSAQQLAGLDIGLDAQKILSNVDMMHWVTSIIVTLVGIGVLAALWLIPVVGPLIAPAGGILATAVAESIASHRGVPLGSAASNLKHFQKKKDETIQKMCGQIKSQVEGQLTAQMGKDYGTYLDQMEQAARSAVEIMSLQRFPDRNRS